MKYIFYYNTRIGRLAIAENDGAICNIGISRFNIFGDFLEKETPLIKKASIQIEEYLSGSRNTFNFPLAFSGTNFQNQVWKALLQIPYGETRSYKDIALSINNPKSCRAVGMANNKNPIIIVIPCHRVIGANGKLVGYGGGLHIKKALLLLENENKK